MTPSPKSNLAGWVVVGVCFMVLSVSFAARSLLGLSMPNLQQDMGWSRSFLSSGGSIALLVMAATAPVAGNLINRFGARPLLFAGLGFVGLGMLGVSVSQAPWQFLAAIGIVGGLGFGMAATHAVSTIVSLMFERNRGLAVGTATAGSTAGQFFVVPVVAAVLVHGSWRWSYLTIGVISLVMALLVLLVVKPGAARGRRHGQANGPFLEEVASLFRRPVFHLLFWSYVICGFTTSGIIETHFLPYAATCGFPPVESAFAYGVLSAVNLGGMVLAGWLTDRMSRPLLLGGIYILRGIAFILLIQASSNIALLFAFAVMFGLFDYATVPVTASLAASHIGLRVLGLTMGLLSAGHSIGAAAGAYMGGLIFDLSARYLWVWEAALVLALIAGLLSLAISDRAGSRFGPTLEAA